MLAGHHSSDDEIFTDLEGGTLPPESLRKLVARFVRSVAISKEGKVLAASSLLTSSLSARRVFRFACPTLPSHANDTCSSVRALLRERRTPGALRFKNGNPKRAEHEFHPVTFLVACRFSCFYRPKGRPSVSVSELGK